MARPSIKNIVTEKVLTHLEDASSKPPGAIQYSVAAVADVIGHDRRVLKKYGLDKVIYNAAKRDKRARRNRLDNVTRSFEERLQAATAEAQKLRGHRDSLLAQLALVEANAKRLAIDPEELYKPLPPPDRRVPAIFNRKPNRNVGRR